MRHLLFSILLCQSVFAQFAPGVGQAGTTAMYKDSSAFTAWANTCIITRGLQDISNPSLGDATVGDSLSPLGIADGNVLSLGDGGEVICSFQNPVYDGPGYDFAVFENSFDGQYLEFAFVEVSSDGVHFFRFPAISNIQDTLQTGPFDYSDPSLVSNLAGKYKANYGTPFDLQEMQGTGGLDINHITHIKIIDVVGSINDQYATYDKNNHKVNDPWPTPYASSGFDLDAVGVINSNLNGINKINESAGITLFPNPAKNVIFLKGQTGETHIQITSVNGDVVLQQNVFSNAIDISSLQDGVYFVRMMQENKISSCKLIVTK